MWSWSKSHFLLRSRIIRSGTRAALEVGVFLFVNCGCRTVFSFIGPGRKRGASGPAVKPNWKWAGGAESWGWARWGLRLAAWGRKHTCTNICTNVCTYTVGLALHERTFSSALVNRGKWKIC